MTQQIPYFFDYDGEQYCLLGYTGGKLTVADDIGMRFSPCPTANYAGHTMIYGISVARMLVIKRIEVCGDELEPITHQYEMTMNSTGVNYYKLDRVIPLTGYVLFSMIGKFSYLRSFSERSNSQHDPLFEAHVNEGYVLSVTNISPYVQQSVAGHEREEFALWKGGATTAEKLANIQRAWEFTGIILPRKYDVLFNSIYYFSFPEYINDLKHRSS